MVTKGTRLTWHASSGNWKKVVLGRCFYLGPDERQAEEEARQILKAAQTLKANGIKVWPPGSPDRVAIRRLLGLVPSLQGVPGIAAVTASPSLPYAPEVNVAPQAEPFVGALTVEEAARLYADYQLKRKERKPSTINTFKWRLGEVSTLLGRTIKLANLGTDELAAFVASVRQKCEGTGRAKMIILCRAFLKWCAVDPRTAYKLPPHFGDVLEVNQRNDATSKKTKHFTSPQLKALYHHADERMKAWLLLCLNCAWEGAGEISNLTPQHFEIKGDSWKVIKGREKTGEKGHWELWPETIAALKATADFKGKRCYSNPSGGKLDGHDFSDRFKALKLKAKIDDDDLTMRCIRHNSANAIYQLSESNDIRRIHQAQRMDKLTEAYTHALKSYYKYLKQLRKEFMPVFKS